MALDAFYRHLFYVALACALITSYAKAQGAATYEPIPGQQGKDVVWIPSPSSMVDKMLDVAGVTADDFVIDLGSGDGRNVIAAAKRGARALGVEYNPDLVALSTRSAQVAGVADKATFVQGDMFEADIGRATVLILFLIPDNLAKLTPKFLALKPGTRIVSNTYEIGGGWEPVGIDRLNPCITWCTAHLYLVPANVAGPWRTPDGVLTLEQNLQELSGTYDIDGIAVPIENGRVAGMDIRFTVSGIEYAGRVNGNAIDGTKNGRAKGDWRAVRATR